MHPLPVFDDLTRLQTASLIKSSYQKIRPKKFFTPHFFPFFLSFFGFAFSWLMLLRIESKVTSLAGVALLGVSLPRLRLRGCPGYPIGLVPLLAGLEPALYGP